MAKVTKIVADSTPFSVSVPCIVAEQPIGELISAVMPHDLLYQICEFDVRRVIAEDRDVERYLGIQRPLSDSRVREIARYVNFFDATFPSAIIIAIESRCVIRRAGEASIILQNILDPDNPVPKRMIARVIDGQHRVAGLREFVPTPERPKFDCLVTILVGTDLADQGHVFATVNLAQTKVNRSLAIDLYALEQARSPVKTCHSVVVAMDKDPKGPFFHRIKRLGVSTVDEDGRPLRGDTETLTQATVVDGIKQYITSDADADRDAILRGKRLSKIELTPGARLIFRNWFVEDADGKIVVTVSNYFDAVRRRWPDAWERPQPRQILSRSTGYIALSRFLGEAYWAVARPGNVPTVDDFSRLFSRCGIAENDLNSDEYLPGSSGQSKLLRQFREQML